MKFRLLTLALAAAGTLTVQPLLAETNNKPNSSYAFDDGPWQEHDYTLPAYPLKPSWQEFFLSVPRANKLFVDTGTLNMGEDGVVRYVLRMQSPSGAQNISAEGIRCDGRQLRVYAFGDNVNKRWIESMKSVWRSIDIEDEVRKTLREALCKDGSPIKDVNAAIKQLRATR